MEVNVHQAKTNLSRLIAKAVDGEEVVIARNGKPVVKLVPIPNKPKKRILGLARNEPGWELKEGWDAPLTDEELKDWFGI